MSYKAGTVTTVVNNATITGINTQWANTLYNVVKGQIIVITQGTNTDIYTIEEIKNNTSLLLSRPAVRAATNATYEILTTLNNSVSDDTIKLGNEIVAMGDFMRIMQAWTTGTGDTITVTWGSQQITMASVSGLQKQIDSKVGGQAIGIPDKTDILAYFAAGDKTSGPYSTGGGAINGPVGGIHTYYWIQRQKGYGTLEAKSISGGPVWMNGHYEGKWTGWIPVLSGSASTQVTEGEIRTRKGIGAWDADNKNALMTSVVRGRPDFYMMIDGQVWTPRLPETNGFLLPQRYSGSDAVPMWRVIGHSGNLAGWVKVATIGTGDTSAQNGRYLFHLISTVQGYGSTPSSGYATLAVTTLNGQGVNANKNFDAYFLSTGHNSGTDNSAPIRIKQLSTWEAEIWLRIGSYSSIVASCTTLDSLRIGINYGVVSDSDLPVTSSNTTSTYDAQISRRYATSGGVAMDYGSTINWDRTAASALRVKMFSGGWTSWPTRPAAINVVCDSPAAASSVFRLDSHTGKPLAALGVLSADDASTVTMGLHWGSSTSQAIWFKPDGSVSFPSALSFDGSQAMKLGEYGWGGHGEMLKLDQAGMDSYIKARSGVSRVFRNETLGGTTVSGQYNAVGLFKADDTFTAISAAYNGANVKVVGGNHVNYFVHNVYTDRNTTKDSNGNLKAASPVIKLFKDKLVCNEESQGVQMERLDKGIYLIKGVLGLNADESWGGIHGGIVVPRGINGHELVWVDYKVKSDGDIVIYTNYRKLPSDTPPQVVLNRITTYPEFMDDNGDEIASYAPCDIPDGHWIDIRVQMSEQSVYNQMLRMHEQMMIYKAMTEYQQGILKNDIKQLN